MKKLIMQFISLFRGMLLAFVLPSKRDTVLVLNNQHIGDICYGLSLLAPFCEQYAKKVIVIWDGKFREVYDSFGITELFFMDSKSQNDLLLYLMKTPMGKRSVKKKKFVVTHTSYYIPGDVQEKNNITVMRLLREKAYKLPVQTSIQYPNVIQNDFLKIVTSLGIREGLTVYINPSALSMSIPRDFFQSIVDCLLERGYDVITNLSSDSAQPLDGTRGVFYSLCDSYKLLEYCGNTIGVRSGFYDFTISSKCNFYVIYPSDYFMRKAYSLSAWNSGNQLYEYTFDNNVRNKVLDDILSHFPYIKEGQKN